MPRRAGFSGMPGCFVLPPGFKIVNSRLHPKAGCGKLIMYGNKGELPSMLILGIDPGFAIVGFGVVEAGRNQQRLIRCGTITTQAGIALPARLQIGRASWRERVF